MPATAAKVRQYEGMFLFGTAAGTNVDGALATVRQLVEKHGGEVIVLKKFDERRLAYEIKKNKRGLYVLCYFRGNTETPNQITREVNLGNDVLRLLIVDASHLSEAEMNAVEPQKYEPGEERRGRRPAMAASDEDGDDDSSEDDE